MLWLKPEMHLSEEYLLPAVLDLLWLEFGRCDELLTLFTKLNTVLSMDDKLLLTHSAGNTILPAPCVLDLHELSVKEKYEVELLGDPPDRSVFDERMTVKETAAQTGLLLGLLVLLLGLAGQLEAYEVVERDNDQNASSDDEFEQEN